MADQGQGIPRPPRRVLFLGHSFVSRFQRHCDTRLINNVGLDPQLVSFVAMGRPGACLSFARDVIHDDDSSSCINNTDCLILQIEENGINCVSCEPIQLARDILRVARDCLDRGNVEFIGIGISVCIRILPSEVETRQQSSSEMMIPVLELLTFHFGKGHVSELNILDNRCTTHPQLRLKWKRTYKSRLK